MSFTRSARPSWCYWYKNGISFLLLIRCISNHVFVQIATFKAQNEQSREEELLANFSGALMMIQIGFGDPWIPQHGNAANAKVFYFIEIVVIFVLFPLSAYGIKSCAFGLYPPSLGGKMDYKWAPLSSHDKASSLLTLHGLNWGDPTWKICADFFRAGITHIRQNRCCLQACFAASSSN